MFKNLGAQAFVCILDCASGLRTVITQDRLLIGSAPGSDLQLNSVACPQTLCTVTKRGDLCEFKFTCQVVVDGQKTDFLRSMPGEEHTVVGGGHLLAIKHTHETEAWMALGSEQSAFVYDHDSQEWFGPYGPQNLNEWLRQRSESKRNNLVLIPSGMEEMGFHIRDAQDVLRIPPPATTPVEKRAWLSRIEREEAGEQALQTSASPPPSESVAEAVNSEYGEFTCPICWFKFDRGDVMNISVHNSLRGDPMLGEDHMQRFHATRFNDRGQAVDAMGIATSDLACPHCRRKLPPGFLDLPHHIFSIVGAPSSGKSYYLSVLAKVLQASLFRTFGITFRDADPSENVILTQMKTQLFSSSSAADAFLAKTDLEGALYETLPRQGRKVRLPKPFIFRLSHPDSPDSGFSVVFYDNAGEHFEPTRNSADSPGAQHIAVASGIFFLFDPLHNTDFRARITGVTDPQLKSQRLDQQDVILAESEVRIKSLLGMDSRQRVATPLAVMVGKCDTWEPLLGEEPLLPVLVDGVVSLPNIKVNSTRIRKFMLDVCPSIVANAEAISSNVSYFAISPLGCSPVEFIDREGTQRIGPDPKQINPRHVEGPSLWVLSQVAPELIPSQPLS